MKVFMYQAALLCSTCGLAARVALPIPEGAIVDNESTYDSAEYPKGPYADGGGKADCPQHCDHCGEFLENSLTDAGEKYLYDLVLEHLTEDVPDGTKRTVSYSMQEWIEYYDVNLLELLTRTCRLQSEDESTAERTRVYGMGRDS